jgi:hypothetical protein
VVSEWSTIYILRPTRNSRDTSPWYIALWSATAVTLVYRKGWSTMLEIARGLLELRVSFSTVVEQSTVPPPKTRRESKGLGKRPAKYWVTMADLNAYKQRRNKILLSSAGRAIRLCGGLVGRIAAELVPDVQVLSGPIMCDSIIAQADGVYFVDDGVSDELLDCIKAYGPG